MRKGAKQAKGVQITKRCHWVPQSYLKGFAADPKREKIWRLGKDAGDPELKPIDKVAVRFHLYVPRDAESGRRDDAFEKKLSELEQWFDSVIWRRLQTDMLDLSDPAVRKMVALLVATMYLRNPQQLELYKRIHRQTVDMIAEAGQVPESFEYKGKVRPLDVDSWPAYRDASEDDLKRAWIADMNGAASHATKLMSLRWSVVCAPEPVFITTDAPVTFIHPSLEFRGINNPETCIMFPISPTRMLHLDHLHDQPANQYYPLKDDGSAANVLLWRNALEYMFSHRPTDEVCAAIVADAERQGFA